MLLVELWVWVTGRQISRPYRTLELDSEGIHLSGNRSTACFIPYSAVRNVQTYLDECVDEDARRGVILGVDGGRAFTLELGENTGPVVNAICHHTQVKALHSRCSWQDPC